MNFVSVFCSSFFFLLKHKTNVSVLESMEDGLKLHTLSSLISGFVYSVCSNPMDVLKTRYVSTTSIHFLQLYTMFLKPVFLKNFLLLLLVKNIFPNEWLLLWPFNGLYYIYSYHQITHCNRQSFVIGFLVSLFYYPIWYRVLCAEFKTFPTYDNVESKRRFDEKT